MADFLRISWAILAKDIKQEFRTKESISSILIFSISVLVIFHFGINPEKVENQTFLPALYWITIVFAGILRLNRTFENEREDNAWKLLILLPFDKSSIYVGKLFGNLFVFLILEIILLPLFIIFFNVNMDFSIWKFFLISMLGMLGFSALGTIISAVSMNLKMKEIMLPVLLIPLLIPVLIASVEGTIACFENLDSFWKWVKLIAAFDTIYVGISILLFDSVTS